MYGWGILWGLSVVWDGAMVERWLGFWGDIVVGPVVQGAGCGSSFIQGTVYRDPFIYISQITLEFIHKVTHRLPKGTS